MWSEVVSVKEGEAIHVRAVKAYKGTLRSMTECKRGVVDFVRRVTSDKPLNRKLRAPQGLPGLFFIIIIYCYLFTTCNWVGTRWQESFKHIT